MVDKERNDQVERLCNELQAVTKELRVIKIFAAAVVAFIGPMLVASIYSMNFKHMPELDNEFGFPMALMLMVLAAVVPYLFFKFMKWL
jgi:magnesium transporter